MITGMLNFLPKSVIERSRWAAPRKRPRHKFDLVESRLVPPQGMLILCRSVGKVENGPGQGGARQIPHGVDAVTLPPPGRSRSSGSPGDRS